MKLQDLKPAEGSTQPAFRKGRGAGSGNGKTAGRGHKGQWARSGGGFHNIFGTENAVVNVSDLNRFEDGAVVTAADLVEAGLVKKTLDGVKVLGNGEITKKLTVQAAAFSASAKEKIEAAGGKAEVV